MTVAVLIAVLDLTAFVYIAAILGAPSGISFKFKELIDLVIGFGDAHLRTLGRQLRATRLAHTPPHPYFTVMILLIVFVVSVAFVIAAT